ncbi:MAG: hypothetical protein KBS83_00305 [Lachnospiraceae bacterium]|nr:hypothetical protein [Candidatus Equihabitans merdae]
MKNFYTVNAGLYFRDGDNGIFIDGIHGGKSVGFSSMPQEIKNDLEEPGSFFAPHNLFLFTHDHPDHYQRDLLCKTLKTQPDASVYGPMIPESNIAPEWVDYRLSHFDYKDWSIYCIDAKHDGKGFENVILQSYLIKHKDYSILVGGDGVFTPAFLRRVQQVQRGHLTAAFINVYQLGSECGREFLKEMSPRMIYMYHLPFVWDDKFDIRGMSRRLCNQYRDEFPRLAVLSPMTKVII